MEINKNMMKIYRPIGSNKLTQRFGANEACVGFTGIHPVKVVKKVNGICPSGTRDMYQAMGMKGHNGEDWATWYREPCYFPVESNLTWKARTEIDRDGGKGVDVISNEEINLTGTPTHIKFRFWHLADSAVHDGQAVIQGQRIGYCDSTGASSGNHLHFSMKFCDSNGKTIYPDNGFRGAVDFRPWFINEFVQMPIKPKNNLVDELNKLIFLLQNIGK